MIDCIIAWLEEIIELTIKSVLKFKEPPLALITAEPTVSPTDKDNISKYPPSDSNKEVDISGSFGSWLTLIVKSVKLSQSVLESITPTVGLNGIQATLPVLPPTQLPQLSIKAVPSETPLQSTFKQTIVKGNVWTSTSPISEFIVEVNVKIPGTGFVNNPVKTTHWLLPCVTLLLSGNEFIIIRIPLAVFSIVKEEYNCPVMSSIALTEILSELTIKSTNNVVVILWAGICPPAIILIEDPTVSFMLNPVKSKYPPSEVKKAEATSGSLGSWENVNEKSVSESHSTLDNVILTVGVNPIHGKFPVAPPTQFPQLSIQAIPLGVLLQSTG